MIQIETNDLEETNNKNTKETILKYTQQRFYSAFVEIIESYNKALLMADFLNAVNAAFYMDTRINLTPHAHMPNRSKGFSSFSENAKKEFLKNLDAIPNENCTTLDIDQAVDNFKYEVLKDLLGATLVVHTTADFSEYCEKSDDLELKKLYYQNMVINDYLRGYWHKKDKIDISEAFIDGDKDLDVPHEVVPLDIENISTVRDYYDQLIGLLTLLTNVSIFGISPNLSHSSSNSESNENSEKPVEQRIISEIDLPVHEIINLIDLNDDTTNSEDYKDLQKILDEYKGIVPPEIIEMKRITDKTNELNSHISFDLQLIDAINSKKELEEHSKLDSPLSDKQKTRYLTRLRHLKDNLKKLRNDRLHNYIIKTELKRIIERVDSEPQYSFNIKVKHSKEVNYTNGYSSNHTILNVNGTDFELQSRTEFRDEMTKEGNPEHNSSLPGKAYDVEQFFELKNPTGNKEVDEKLFSIYCNFLNCMSNDSIKEPNSDNARQIYYANIAKSQLKVKEFFLLPENSIPYTYSNYPDSKNSHIYKDLDKKYRKNLKELSKKIRKKRAQRYGAIYNRSKRKYFVGNIEINHNTISFVDYIKQIIKYECANSGNIKANHSDGDHNTVAITYTTEKEALLARFRSRVGVSALAYMVISKYVEENPKALEGMSVNPGTKSEINRIAMDGYETANKQLSEQKTLDTTFHPQGR